VAIELCAKRAQEPGRSLQQSAYTTISLREVSARDEPGCLEIFLERDKKSMNDSRPASVSLPKTLSN
jgi:hypothetical protein